LNSTASDNPSAALAPPAPPAFALFTGYEKFVIALLAFLQFTVSIDFAILAPLGPVLMPALKIEASDFGLVVSAYAFAAGISGILTAGFADRFDRKRLLLVFYAGFLLGTLWCGFAPTFHLLLAARVVAGFFGGVIASIVMAIVADLFAMQVRGRVMGWVQAAFSATQVIGIPLGLWLGNHFGWHGPFRVIAIVGLFVGIVIVAQLKPLTAHLKYQAGRHPLKHLLTVATTPRYLVGFAAMMLTATGAYMIAPFATVFSVHNLGVPTEKLPTLFMASGFVGLIAGPLLGRLADAVGKFKVLTVSTALHLCYIIWYTHLGLSPLWLVFAAQCTFAVLLSGRISSTAALVSAVPAPPDRGAYMSVSSSMQQLSGGVASWIAGMVVMTGSSGEITNYYVLGWIIAGTMTATWLQMRRVNKMVGKQ